MYEFVRGPLLWIAVIIFIAGFIHRTVRLFQLTKRIEPALCPASDPKNNPGKSVSKEEARLEKIARFQNSVLGRHPVMTIVSAVFHFCLFATPLFLLAHNVMLRSGLGISLPSVPDALADSMTIIVLGCGLFFLVRRIAVPKVAAISGTYDYVALFIVILPYLTGFLAYHQVFEYRTMIIMHMLTGELMLIVLPFTKVGHMVFFFFSRLTLAGEYCMGRGSRTWST